MEAAILVENRAPWWLKQNWFVHLSCRLEVVHTHPNKELSPAPRRITRRTHSQTLIASCTPVKIWQFLRSVPALPWGSRTEECSVWFSCPADLPNKLCGDADITMRKVKNDADERAVQLLSILKFSNFSSLSTIPRYLMIRRYNTKVSVFDWLFSKIWWFELRRLPWGGTPRVGRTRTGSPDFRCHHGSRSGVRRDPQNQDGLAGQNPGVICCGPKTFGQQREVFETVFGLTHTRIPEA
jgi:hypothetical protein